MSFELPSKGFVFWPIGTGDSSTIVVVEDDIVVQVDLHHLESAGDDDDPRTPIVDELERLLPKRDKRPYLAVFILTHPDKDHILGFKDLLDRVDIGEIWHTPRIFREYNKDLCDDAIAFKNEVKRRRDKTIETGGDTSSGDRVRVIGHDDIFENDDYKDFPDKWRSIPSDIVSKLDGEDLSESFEAFIHAPFKDNAAGERNETSLALHITLKEGEKVGKTLLLGDLSYPTIKQIFDITKERERPERLEWNALLSPHHCSKKVMYWKESDDDKEQFKPDIMDDFESAQLDPAYIIASSDSDFSDKKGKNPPHAKARKRYEEILESNELFKCTQEHPNTEDPEPIKFELTGEGFKYIDPKEASEEDSKSSKASDLSAAVRAARGSSEPPAPTSRLWVR